MNSPQEIKELVDAFYHKAKITNKNLPLETVHIQGETYVHIDIKSDIKLSMIFEINTNTDTCFFIKGECYLNLDAIKHIDPIKLKHNFYGSLKKDQLQESVTYIKQMTYLMVDGNGYVKIGKSLNPNKRERTLQSENPSIKMIAVCNDDIELKLHKAYKKYRKRGEWFSLSKAQVNKIIDKYSFMVVS